MKVQHYQLLDYWLKYFLLISKIFFYLLADSTSLEKGAALLNVALSDVFSLLRHTHDGYIGFTFTYSFPDGVT